jgi:hypothetical protein
MPNRNHRRQLLTSLGSSGPSDTTAPTVTITSTASGATAAAFTVTVTFSEAVIGFDNTKITVVNGSAGAVAGTGPYTSVITPTATGTVTVQVEAAKVTDAALNPNTASNTFSILYVAAVLWLKADAGVFTDAGTTPATADGDAIGQWNDQSGNSNHFSQTLTKRPLLKLGVNGINSKPTILFDGSDDLLVRAANISTATAGTMIAVVRMTATSNTDNSILGSMDEATAAVYGCFLITTSQKIRSWQRNNDTADDNRGDTTLADATTYIITFSSSGTAYAHRVNGAAQTLSQSSGANNGDWFGDAPNRDSFTVGGLKYSVESAWMKGSIAELLLFDTQLTGANLTAVESYFNGRYAAF